MISDNFCELNQFPKFLLGQNKMPRQKKKLTNQNSEHFLKKDETMNSTIMDIHSKIHDINHTKLVMWKSEVKEKMNEACMKLNDIQKEKLAMFELDFRTSLMAIPKNILNSVIDINNEEFRSFFLGADVEIVNESNQILSSQTLATAKKRRSRSASTIKFNRRTSQRLHRLRSSSADPYRTPKTGVRLSSIMSNKKYTVSKPKKAENSGVHVKRIMKPDEEAISTCGSPLYVASCTLGAPHVNIPLPGGVVLNIEPKTPKGPVELPGLDLKTRNQIKMLCEQLKKLF